MIDDGSSGTPAIDPPQGCPEMKGARNDVPVPRKDLTYVLCILYPTKGKVWEGGD